RVAVADALAFIEERVAACRIRENGTVTRHETGNLVIASFDHSSSRAKDAQLHTHNLIMNLTMDSYGKWRSLESSELYKIHHEADRVYKQVLAQKALTLGYDLIKTKHGPELSCVPEEYRDLRSTRKNQIDDYLEKRGLTRETASASIRDLGNLATRMAKDLGMDRVALLDEWRRTAKEAGFQSKDHVAGEEKRMEKGAVLELAAENADNAVDRAIKHLELRESRFSTNELKDRALEFGHGSNMTLKDVEDAVKRSNKLAPAKYNDKWGFTTHNALKAEAIMLGIELNGRHRGESMMTVEEAEAITAEASKNNEYGFNKGQTEAIIGTLSNQAQIQAVQGYAGTSKTNSVAATVRQAMTDKGFKVVGMAPTSKARNQLTECAGIAEGFTVDKFLGECQRGAMNNTDDPQYWIVDEASMLSASKMRDLLREAEKQNAKVLLIGDIKQLSSIDAGAAFRQLQESGMVTYVLDEIVRQKNTHAKEGVFNAMKGNVAEAMAHIDRNAKVVEVKDDVERRQEMTSDYLAMTKEQRSETLVLEPTRAGRNEANDLIRAGLREAGELSGVELQATRLDGKDLTPSEKELVSNYEKDELITFNKNLASIGIEAGEYYRVGDVDLNSGVVTLKGQKDQEIEWRPERMGASSANVFQAVETNLTAGDKITWKQNDKEKGLDNGDELVVLSAEKGVITAIDTKGKEHGIDPAKHNDQHFAYSYATTVHASQGMTKDNALANFSSKDSNLLNQQLFYVGASRVKDAFQLYTDNRERLTNVIQSKTGQKST
ncbi:MAG: MobF family relaxase, partial [Spongiibacteraceae bacterium]